MQGWRMVVVMVVVLQAAGSDRLELVVVGFGAFAEASDKETSFVCYWLRLQ